MSSTRLFKAIEPFTHEHLKVSELHSLYLEQSGTPEGKPIVFIHGVLVVVVHLKIDREVDSAFCLEENTTWDLVEDIEKIRVHLKIDKWVVFGGSWGSTLSLAYAQAHPDKVKGLILRGIFALRRAELEFFYQGPGTNFIFPEYWEDYVRSEAAKRWSVWECSTSRLIIDPEYIKKANEDDFADKFARIECHYFVNGGG
ncbi:hypothetical protein KEM48_009005 [Puccinia striiformis f. sp. tritici PST-130]|nr:hypothetical protein KEM48_009005 [Puccinia striiformis f. sp. tritici PST-130]